MEALSHVTLGALTGLACAHLEGMHGTDAAVAGIVAGLTSTLPDLCQSGWWRTVDKWTPDELLGRGGPLQHRGITHWWAVPAALWLIVLPQSTGSAHLLLAAATVGIASHLAGDFVVGKGGYGRGPGIPLMPWWAHIGIGLDCGGLVERVLIRPLLILGLLPAIYLAVIGGSL